MASSPSCSISGSWGGSHRSSQSESQSVQWSTSSSHHSPEPRPVDRPLTGTRPVGGRTSVRTRPAVAGSSRVTKESPEGTASSMSVQDIANLRVRYGFPPDLHLFVPTSTDRATSSRSGRVALYGAFFKAGLRLPIHPFILNLLDRYSLTPSQLVPNSFRTIVGFLVLCHLQGIEASISLFRSFYTLRKQSGWWSFTPRPNRILRLCLPSSVKGWKDKFFFADISGVRGSWGEPNIDANRDASILPRDRMAFGKLLTADIPKCNKLIAEESLQRAGLIPARG